MDSTYSIIKEGYVTKHTRLAELLNYVITLKYIHEYVGAYQKVGYNKRKNFWNSSTHETAIPLIKIISKECL